MAMAMLAMVYPWVYQPRHLGRHRQHGTSSKLSTSMPSGPLTPQNMVIFGDFLKDLWYSIKLSGKQENKSTQNNQIQMHNIFMYFFEVPTNKSRRKASPCLAPLPLPPAWRKRGWNAGAGNWGWTRFPLIFWCFNCQVGIIIF